MERRAAQPVRLPRPDLAAIGFHDLLADRQPHAHAAALGGYEAVEQRSGNCGVDARSFILNRNFDLRIVDPPRGDQDLVLIAMLGVGRLDRIAEQVEHHLLTLQVTGGKSAGMSNSMWTVRL